MEHLTFQVIAGEQSRQVDLWGNQDDHPDLLWLAILTEEVGELAQAILQTGNADGVQAELTQVAAVAATWLDAIHRKQG